MLIRCQLWNFFLAHRPIEQPSDMLINAVFEIYKMLVSGYCSKWAHCLENGTYLSV
jgi:hypothetical protein